MLRDSKAFSSFSVDDTQKAKPFYGQTLGLDVSDVPEMQGLLQSRRGKRGPDLPEGEPCPATFTILNFPVSDVEQTVDNLTRLGVRFERYDGKDIKTDAKGISRGQGLDTAWFKDPAGNILSVLKQK